MFSQTPQTQRNNQHFKLLGRVDNPDDQLHVNAATVAKPSLPATPLLENTMSAYLENKLKIPPLVDSGASHSVISTDTLHKVRPAALLPTSNPAARAAHGSSIPLLGQIQFHITLGKMTVAIKLLAVLHLSRNLIMGRDTISVGLG